MTNEQKSALDRFFDANPAMAPSIPSGIGAGWESAVIDALQKLKALSAETGVAIKPMQIKEKFGALRMYVGVDEDSVEGLQVLEQTDSHVRLGSTASPGSARDRAYAIVREAEEITAARCYTCGASNPELKNRGGWISSLCAKCDAAREAIR